MYTIAWLLFILACIAAVPIAAMIDSMQRKKAQREALMADEEPAEAIAEEPLAEEDGEQVVVAEDAPAELVEEVQAVEMADGDDLFGQDLPK
ncbi:hypothetical protein [Roseimaritima ulvae]|uniref:Uncharacterized protein n=1 Tax=Roseimaritima ulvae TaxID=980254 RepID=A0A5B9QTL7_9BACT|nr:hypothetical protein [Roseimaritima ulvae]QEG42397.1 hypothetical protein UC8_44320 [Roseimaritima ulvae]